jgi:hypothetical protein
VTRNVEQQPYSPVLLSFAENIDSSLDVLICVKQIRKNIVLNLQMYTEIADLDLLFQNDL